MSTVLLFSRQGSSGVGCAGDIVIWINIGSANGLLPDSTKPLPEPMLTYYEFMCLLCCCSPGKEVPESAVLEMKGNFQLPQESDPWVDNIMWLELSRDQAQPLIQQ